MDDRTLDEMDVNADTKDGEAESEDLCDKDDMEAIGLINLDMEKRAVDCKEPVRLKKDDTEDLVDSGTESECLVDTYLVLQIQDNLNDDHKESPDEGKDD